MELKILCPQWGHEHLPVEEFLIKVKNAGYDGVDTWLPEDARERKHFIRLLREYELLMVSHQHQARGNSLAAFCRSFEYYLNLSMECDPVLINSHSGRDAFTPDEQLQVLDTAQEFADRNNVVVAHETHRGRIGFSPGNAAALFALRPGMKITADLSHWVCVTESYLEYFGDTVAEAIRRTEHLHARVGFPEGPQVPDPRSPFWKVPLDFFLALWGKMIAHQRLSGRKLFTITTEFGPPPYMWTSVSDHQPLASQWDINVFMKDLLKKTFVAP